MTAKVILIDNFDSFTYNLVETLKELGAQCIVYRNNTPIQIIAQAISKHEPSCLFISPGPKSPNEAGNCLAYIEAFKSVCPIFGICLGHQSIGHAFGGHVYQMDACHGKAFTVKQNGDSLFKDIPCQFKVGRYHSLAVTCPESFKPIAKMGQLTMAMKHKTLPIYGMQFHPESILTEFGENMMKNILSITCEAFHHA